MTPDPAPSPHDETTAELARLYRESPAWRQAASRISDRSTSGVWFSHRPGDPWHLARAGGVTELLPGPADDPDFMFRFTPASVRALHEVEGGVGDFAVRLFELMIDPDPEVRVGFRIVASFARLAYRGYTRLLLESGPALAEFAASHGVVGLGSLRRVIAALRESEPAEWEVV